MNMNMNTSNGPVRPATRSTHGAGPVVLPADSATIQAGKASEALPVEDKKAEEAIYTTAEAAVEAAARPRIPKDPCCGSEHRIPNVTFCETITLNEGFDTSCINPACTRICYETEFLGFTVETKTMMALLPCGGHCEIPVQMIRLTGAIPYLINVGPVRASCGSPIDLCFQGVALVDSVVGYLCGDEEPELDALTCENVLPVLCVSTEPCGCSCKTNVTVCGKFTFCGLPGLV